MLQRYSATALNTAQRQGCDARLPWSGTVWQPKCQAGPRVFPEALSGTVWQLSELGPTEQTLLQGRLAKQLLSYRKPE